MDVHSISTISTVSTPRPPYQVGAVVDVAVAREGEDGHWAGVDGLEAALDQHCVPLDPKHPARGRLETLRMEINKSGSEKNVTDVLRNIF